MNIGQAAAQSGLNNKTVRYYEEIGLVIPRRQTGNEYRDYSARDVEELSFLQRSRMVGFSLDECRTLLELYRDPTRQSSQVKHLALQKLKSLEVQLAVLTTMRETLISMVEGCVGDESSACAIIDTLAQSETVRPVNTPGMAFTIVDNN